MDFQIPEVDPRAAADRERLAAIREPTNGEIWHTSEDGMDSRNEPSGLVWKDWARIAFVCCVIGAALVGVAIYAKPMMAWVITETKASAK